MPIITDTTTTQHALAGWLHGTNGTAVFCRCGLAFFARFDEQADPLALAKQRLEAHQQEASR